jgi:hypothetical protein
VSLDLTKIASQVGSMVTRLKSGIEERQNRLQYALDVLHNQAGNVASLTNKINSSKTTWLVAGLTDRLDQHYKAPAIPPEFTVIATDGSHIDVDRHKSTRCYLINIGTIVLHYGNFPDAILNSIPSLYSEDEDLIITPTEGKNREQPVEGTLLGIKRSVDECHQLTKLTAEQPPAIPTLALLDGSLIFWGLEAYPEFITEALLDKGFLSHLEDMKKINRNKDRKIALASYISFPRSTDVVNALRVALCPHNPADCDHYCPPGAKRDCDTVAGIRDRDLFLNLLEQGERSALFTNQSSIVQRHYGEHWVYFFYFKVEEEVARVEIPRWVAMDESLLNLTHTLVLDQRLLLYLVAMLN